MTGAPGLLGKSCVLVAGGPHQGEDPGLYGIGESVPGIDDTAQISGDLECRSADVHYMRTLQV